MGISGFLHRTEFSHTFFTCYTDTVQLMGTKFLRSLLDADRWRTAKDQFLPPSLPSAVLCDGCEARRSLSGR